MTSTLVPFLVGAAAVGFFWTRPKPVVPAPTPAPEKPYQVIESKPLTDAAIKAWGVLKPKTPIVPFTYEPRALGENDIEIKITHCGICHSDIHQMDNGWSFASIFPMVVGHEIVGVVVSAGSKVSELKVGDRVGVGAQCCSCLNTKTCKPCATNLEQYCDKSTGTYNSKYQDGTPSYGGYATRVRVHSHFAIKLPETLDSAKAAPLFCAGATVYEPLRRWNMGKGHKVGIIGIGGLGHLGIQFAAALGCETVAISTTASKKELAHQLGATGFISSPEEKKAAKGTFDFIIQTDNYTTDITEYLGLLKPFGTLCLVGIAESKLQVLSETVIFGSRDITGSMIASPSRIKEMLQLCAEKNIVSYIQEWPIEKVNEAVAGVRKGEPRFRFVLKIQDA